jgi:hypothetical protein
MKALDLTENSVQDWFKSIGTVVENEFISPVNKANSEIILRRAQNRHFDASKFIEKIKSLPDTPWSPKIVLEIYTEFNNELGISEEFIQKHSIGTLTSAQLKETKWELVKRIMADYGKNSLELYDTLKYSQNPNLSSEKERLLLDLMKALKEINQTSRDLVQRFEARTYNPKSLQTVLKSKMPIDHIFLRIYYILLNIHNTDNLELYGRTLSLELYEFTLHKIQ